MEVFHQMKVVAGERIKFNIEGLAPIQVNGDIDRIKQVFLNLVGNAIQYTQPGGQVRMIMETGDNWVKVSVKDNWTGDQ